MNPPSIEEIEARLNSLYFRNPKEYKEQVEMFKGMGFKVLRNSSGKHKVQSNPNFIYEAFGGVFGNIFGGT